MIGSLDYCLMYYKSLIDWLYYCWFNHKVICYPDINEMTYKFPDIVVLPKSANFHQTNTYRASTVGHMQLEQPVIQWWTRKIHGLALWSLNLVSRDVVKVGGEMGNTLIIIISLSQNCAVFPPECLAHSRDWTYIIYLLHAGPLVSQNFNLIWKTNEQKIWAYTEKQ